jgi:hypothetical protein
VCFVHAKSDRRRDAQGGSLPPPALHWSSWEDVPEWTPEERFRMARIAPSVVLHDHDIVANRAEVGDRNEGKYIYKDRALFHLATEPDDYGNLPEWVDTRKDDCGYSYFAEDAEGRRMIDHRAWIPFRTREWEVVESWPHLLERLAASDAGAMWLFSARATRPYTEVAFAERDVLVFGKESAGLPAEITKAHADRLLTIPSRPQVRSLNLANCAAIVAYEAIRQWGGVV